jgi:serine phosphatase RsbU (regulator of sigma subunit)
LAGFVSGQDTSDSLEVPVTLRSKFVIPVNLILVAVLTASLGWEWWRLERSEFAILGTRLDEEARFVHAAAGTFGVSPKFDDFLWEFCHATDATASPEHQVTVVGPGGKVVATAAAHVHHPINPVGLASLTVGSWLRHRGDDSYLIRVSDKGDRRVVVAESTRLLRQRVFGSLIGHAAWILGLGVFLFIVINTVMHRAVLQPIQRLHRAALRLGQGELGVQVGWSGSDELGALSRRFDAMSQTLAAQAEESRRELEAARRVQSHSLPPPLVELGRVRVAGRCIQRGAVGGDVYDVQPLPGDRVAVLVADLSGHDVSAALNTAMLRSIVWRDAEHAESPGEVLARLNERLCRDLPDERFATGLLAWFELTTGRLHYANAGHPSSYAETPPGEWRELESGGPALGVIPGAYYPTTVLDVVPGSRLFACTDGVTETRDTQGRLWGTDELMEILKSSGPGDPGRVIERIIGRLAELRGERPQEDDLTLMLAELAL